MNKVTIVQHNVQHWTNNKTTLTNMYNQIDPDIILLNGLSLTDGNKPKIFNYSCHYVNKENRQHLGTAIAIRHNLYYRLLDDFESDLLGVTVTTRQGPMTIATLYSPPNAPFINPIDFNKLFKRPEPTYFLGDLNARHRLFGYQDRNAVGRCVNTLVSLGTCQYAGPHFPTFITHNSTTSPDIVLTNNRVFHNLYLQPGPLTSSDHIPIVATITVSPIQIPIRPRKCIHRANWTQYKADLSNIHPPTEPNPTLEEIDEQLDNWTRHIQNASDKNIPTIKNRIIPGIKPNETTREIQRQYDEILNDIAYNGPTLDKSRQIIRLRNELRIEYQTQSNQVWNGLIERLDLDEDPTRFWKTVRRLKGTDKQKTPYLKDHHNNKVHTPEGKEILFRNHWTKIFTDEDAEDNSFDREFTEDVANRLNDDFETIRTYDYGDLTRLGPGCPAITTDELKRTIMTFKQKAPGPTGITTEQIRRLPQNMYDYLIHIMNQSLSAGYFPDKLKHAIMIFIPKGNTSQYTVKNYRPISLLDIHAKIFDKILNRRLTHHFHSHNMYNTRQHGFRTHRGTHTALATFQETVAASLANKFCTDVVLRDVAKAFDKVWHTGLKYKITTLHLHPCFTKILTDYLTDRTASIRIDTHIGTPFPLLSGVPQGACLSPTLFSFYTQDMPPPAPHSEYIQFADDITQITTDTRNYRRAALHTQAAIESINTYENKWKIQTNISKFTIINIARRNTANTETYDEHYEYTTQGKILGLHFSRTGIRKHITIRSNIAKDNLTKLYRFRQLSIPNKLKLYKSLVLSALIYPVIPIHTVNNTNILRLQRIQNKALRFVTNTHWQEYRTSQSLHFQLNIEPINTLLHRHAKSYWENIQTNEPQLYNTLSTLLPPDTTTHLYFPSSRRIAEGRPPDPLYR